MLMDHLQISRRAFRPAVVEATTGHGLEWDLAFMPRELVGVSVFVICFGKAVGKNGEISGHFYGI